MATATTPDAAPVSRRGKGDALPAQVPVAGPKGALAYAAAQAGGETFVLRATSDRSMGLPEAARDALAKLTKDEKSGVRELQTAEIGGSIFAPHVVVRADGPAQAKKVQALAKVDGVEVVTMRALLRPAAAKGTGAELAAVLETGTLAERIGALRGLQAKVQAGALDADAATKGKVASAAYSLAHPLVETFNAALLEATRARRTELVAQQPQGGSIGAAMNGFLSGSAAAIAELRAAGGTVEINALGAHLQTLADVLLGLGTRQGRALMAELLPHGDGVLFDVVAKDADAVAGLVDLTVRSTTERIDATREWLAHQGEGAPEGLQPSMSSGGWSVLPGHRSAETARRWSLDDPFDGPPTAPLAFLGTAHAPVVRAAVLDVLLAGDRALPELLALHRAKHDAKERAQWAGFLDDPALTPERRAQLERSIDDQVAKSYDQYRRMNAQGDVEKVVNGLAYVGLRNELVYDAKRGTVESLGLLGDALAQVKTPEMHKLLADAALTAVERARRGDHGGDAGVQAAADALVRQVLTPGPDASVHLAAGVHLVGRGDLQALGLAVQALSHADAEVRDVAAQAVVKAARAAKLALAGDDAEKARLAPTKDAAKPAWTQLWDQQRDVAGMESIVGDTAVARDVLATLSRDAVQPLRKLFFDGAVRPYTKMEGLRGAALLDDAQHTALHLASALLDVDAKATAPYAWQREHAALILATGAATPAAKTALPALERWAAIGARAQGVVAAIDAARAEHGETGGGVAYLATMDPKIVALARPVLTDVAEPGSPAKRALDFVDDPKSVDLRTVPSYSLSNHPSIETAVRELARLGDVAAAARDVIKGA